MVKQPGQCHRLILYHKTFPVPVYCLWSANVNCLCRCVAHMTVTHIPLTHIGVRKCMFSVSMCYIVDFGRLSINNNANKVSVSSVEKCALCNYILLMFNIQYVVPLFHSPSLPFSISSRSRRTLTPFILSFFQKGNLGHREFRSFVLTNFLWQRWE